MTATGSDSLDTTGGIDDPGPLPGPVAKYADYGLYGMAAGTVLCLLSLFTNPVPDPSFPWFTLPASLRIPVVQPRIEHWPVSYTVGVWLFVFGFPALFLKGYQRRVRRGSSTPTRWLVALPTAAVFAWTTYCRFFWPKLSPATWNAPSYTLVCWLYCSSYDPVWSNAAYAAGVVGVAATTLAARRTGRAPLVLVAFGVLTLPLGIPALVEGLRRRDRGSSGGAAGDGWPAGG